MTLIELSDEQAAKLKAKAAAQGLTLEAWFEELADEDTGTTGQVPLALATTRRHIADVIRQRMSKVTSEPSRKLTPAEADQALEDLLDTLPPMPSLPDKALSRESIYAAEDDIR